DRAAFDSVAARDLLTGEEVDTSAAVRLEPGRVMCLEGGPADGDPAAETAEPRLAEKEETLFHIVMPRDGRRDVVVPEGQRVKISAPSHFRVRLIDRETGRTVRVYRSGEGDSVVFDSPRYHGDGTRCRALHLDLTVYDGGRALRSRSRFLVPPTPARARVKQSLDGGEVREHPEYRTILANGAGAASQVRVGWGAIRSQYDAILSANPEPEAPSDRVNLWTRARCWLQREGYTRELDRRCVTKFTPDPAGRFARWEFCVPCGMGRNTAFVFTLRLAEGRNAVRLSVHRVRAGEIDIGDSVRLVFRPDIEWRSFHATTKAYLGPEKLFPEAVRPLGAGGFEFSPYDGTFRMKVDGGEYHHEPQWQYNVAHPEEAERGQDAGGDLFSPGWISADLKIGDSVEMTGELEDGRPPADFFAAPGESAELGFAEALRRAMDLYIARRDDLKTVIAGYPWFLDWGRDTFIFMRGMIAAGMTDDSLQILKAFAAFEESGTLPNIIYGSTAGNRDTTDAQLWFVRCVQELSGAADCRGLMATCNSIVDHYIKGTPNGIHVDPASGLVWSPSHFTWMDTNYPACTPRVGYPVEIQALWISALKFLGRDRLAAEATHSLKKLFRWQFGYRDCLAAPRGEPAAAAQPEDTIRPNQLFLITLGVVKDAEILKATEELLTPGGIRSLNAMHPLYRGVYTGDEDTSRKQAYHNGTAWAWPFPLYAEALAETGSCSRDVALGLLAGAVESLNVGCLCHASEIADGDSPHTPKGCLAQAWSDSEILRVWLKLSRG
ncbi:MAG: glycogen debranching enzyme N-terminal domain-containing protein, partial [Kiritimatiellae bacterium]|nr:glycogen debranching enzyme N-terminal domain-containing protein [Kiritimatiellia bacterium]